MAMNGYVDEPLDAMCEGLFGNIEEFEDFFDFPTYDEQVVERVDSGIDGPPLPAPPADGAPFSSSGDDGSRLTATSEENKFCEDSIDIPEDWFPNLLDDTNFNIDYPAAAAAADKDNDEYIKKDDSLFQSLSPVSVLEPSNLIGCGGGSTCSYSSSSSSTSSNNETDTVSLAMLSVPARARSKRPRRAAPLHVTIPILPPSSEGPSAVPVILECESFAESCPLPTPMKKRNKKSSQEVGDNAITDDAAAAVRKCMHCGILKTPQWRAGPMGPKSLCNACGVRYKSGRLFPEYRPAASPTFVPTLHSNSHKRVVEMRIKATQTQQKAANGMPLPECPAAKNCDLLEYIRWKDQ